MFLMCSIAGVVVYIGGGLFHPTKHSLRQPPAQYRAVSGGQVFPRLYAGKTMKVVRLFFGTALNFDYLINYLIKEKFVRLLTNKLIPLV